jgi:predicted  nucleic acid-binding Zn-ribbon protein
MGRDIARERGRTSSKEADLYSWAMRQAELLRAGRLSEIDPAAIAEEIDDVGEEQYDKLESALRILMLHLLKWDNQPDRRTRSWTTSVREQRRRVLRQLRKNPGLKSRLDEALVEAYEDARDEASGETGMPVNAFPATRPYEFQEIMERPVVWPGDEP